jgi:hypothetical protein
MLDYVPTSAVMATGNPVPEVNDLGTLVIVHPAAQERQRPVDFVQTGLNFLNLGEDALERRPLPVA